MTGPYGVDDVEAWMSTLSNWGRWGIADDRGTANYARAEQVRAAIASVQLGRSVSLAREISIHSGYDPRYGPPLRVMVHNDHVHPGRPDTPLPRAGHASEYFGLVFHGAETTHLDAFGHVSWDGRVYNNRDASAINARTGAGAGAVTGLRDGLMTRGILLDVPRCLQLSRLEPGTPVTRDLVEFTLREEGLETRPGDALLLRTGAAQPAPRTEQGGHRQAGWHVDCLPWLFERHIALIGADTGTEVLPSGVNGVMLPVHYVCLVAMGLWLLDNCMLEDVAEVCAELGRWEFLFHLAPLRIAGGTGSPVNPVAVF